jgi:hypothetical protein
MCGLEKQLHDFYSQNKKSEKKGEYIYYHPECRDCTKKKSMKWKKENPEKVKESNNRFDAKEARIEHFRNKNRTRIQNGKMKEWQRNNKESLSKKAIYRQMHKAHTISTQQWRRCKEYFNNQCAYCGMHVDDHYRTYDGKSQKTDFHKDHFYHKGKNDLSNCIPSCMFCNTSKHTAEFEYWYSPSGRGKKVYSEERKQKIIQWLDVDYKQYINL